MKKIIPIPKGAHPGVIFKKQYILGRYEEPYGNKIYRLHEFAEKTGFSRQYWADIFHARKRVTAKMAILMAKFSNENATHWVHLQGEYDLMEANRNSKYRR